jgi:outer membrane protein TolC
MKDTADVTQPSIEMENGRFDEQQQISQPHSLMRFTKKLVVALLGLCAATSALAETNEVRSLSLEECIQLALEHNFDLKIERFNPEISGYNVRLSYSVYDPVLTLSGRHNYDVSPGGLDPQNRPFPGSQTDANSLSAGLNGELPTGLTYGLSANASEQYGNRAGTDFENSSARVGAFTLNQPLLRDFWIDNARLQIQLRKKDLRISELQLRDRVMVVVNSVEDAYYQLIFAIESVKVQRKAVELGERLLSENKKRVEVGALAPLDEKQSESQVAVTRADLINAERAVSVQENLLKNLITDDYVTWSKLTLVPSQKLEAVPQAFSLIESWDSGMRLRPDLLAKRQDVEKQDITLKYTWNQLFPALDLTGSYGWTAGGTTREFSGALEGIKNGDAPTYSYGAVLSMPLSNRAARENRKIAKTTKLRIITELKKLEQGIMVEIDNSIKLAKSNFERVHATRAAAAYAEEALRAEEKKLANGKSTSFQVLQLQRDLTQARSQEISALADYNTSLSDLSFREGTILTRHKLDLKVK